MPEHEIKVVELIELPATDPARTGKIDLLVLYTFDNAGPFQIIAPKETFTDAELKKRVMEQQKLRLEWKGKSVKV